ncbi:Programmed cell death protein [Zostera marina]|uniref:Programmed cell death protein n=1 Tax=Zostera marina TaxID=29655 RepID=A0A0K9PB72_ZOSMR|nr:Programmed cell death protein [Zostera marina]
MQGHRITSVHRHSENGFGSEEYRPESSDFVGNGYAVVENGGRHSTGYEERRRRVQEEEEEMAYEDFMIFRKEATMIIQEFFLNDDVNQVETDLRELNWDFYHYYFVKKLTSMAMDRQDREKEMAASLISSLYDVLFDSATIHKAFTELVVSADDLILDVPDIIDIVSLFIARAVIDDVLPPSFLTKILNTLDEDSIAAQIAVRAQKVHLTGTLKVDNVLHRWSGSRSMTVEAVRSRINDLLIEYVVGGDIGEAFRCINNMKVSFYHHEIVKRAIILAMERPESENVLLDLLQEGFIQGVISITQMSTGFNRLIKGIRDLCLDIPNANESLRKFISSATYEGWLNISSLCQFDTSPEYVLDENAVRTFKERITIVILEYFSTGDVSEVVNSLAFYYRKFLARAECNGIFVKKLIMTALGRRNRDKEMASRLLTNARLPSDDIMKGFYLLLDSAPDAALDHPYILGDLSQFIARALVDEIITPAHLDETEVRSSNRLGRSILELSLARYRAANSSQMIVKYWGACDCGCAELDIKDIKDKIMRLLEEYDMSGDFDEACRCMRDIGLPFFHHEVVKKTIIYMMGNPHTRMWNLLEQFVYTGVVNDTQMVKGFIRVKESIDDLILDIPHANLLYRKYLSRAILEGIIDLDSYHAQEDICDFSTCQ